MNLDGHCQGWEQVLSKFVRGKGLLWDLEFLNDESGRRVAAFGRAAGIVGMAVGLLAWCENKSGKQLGALSSWKSKQALVDVVKAQIKKVQEENKEQEAPVPLVIGALGRCGGGAVWFAEQCGLTVTKWDMAETKGGGPFNQLLEVDVLINCIYLTAKIPHFLTQEMIERPGRKLSVFCDVSCDTSNPNNPFPIYNGHTQGTTLTSPVLRVLEATGDASALDVVAIDHLPSLIPSDSSEEFSEAIVKHIKDLAVGGHASPVWARAEKLMNDRVEELRATGYRNM